jgi:hypothetical protein
VCRAYSGCTAVATDSEGARTLMLKPNFDADYMHSHGAAASAKSAIVARSCLTAMAPAHTDAQRLRWGFLSIQLSKGVMLSLCYPGVRRATPERG